jgi:LAGLIDADG endonuclease
VRSLDENFEKILPHFDQYPLITQKLADYLLWREVVLIMKRKEHLTDEGVQAIVSKRASINLGITDDLKVTFPNIIPAKRPEVLFKKKIPHSEWVAGFTSAEGTFSVRTPKTQTKLGFKTEVWFRLSQHSRDEELMRSLISFFGCGYLTKDSRGPAVEFSVYKFSDIYGKIYPFFNNYKVRGVKAKDYQDWSEILEIIQVKGHLTQEGLDKILSIKAGINKARL